MCTIKNYKFFMKSDKFFITCTLLCRGNKICDPEAKFVQKLPKYLLSFILSSDILREPQLPLGTLLQSIGKKTHLSFLIVNTVIVVFFLFFFLQFQSVIIFVFVSKNTLTNSGIVNFILVLLPRVCAEFFSCTACDLMLS